MEPEERGFCLMIVGYWTMIFAEDHLITVSGSCSKAAEHKNPPHLRQWASAR